MILLCIIKLLIERECEVEFICPVQEGLCEVTLNHHEIKRRDEGSAAVNCNSSLLMTMTT